jgi:hypothetical protein
MTTWFIDAWSVADGLAFISQRPYNSSDATVTVHISPPDFSPISITSIATALRATRHQFQTGLYDTNEEEIAFESFDQAREVVRRGYMAGGIGLTPRLPPETPITPPKLSQAAMPDDYWQKAHQLLVYGTDPERAAIAVTNAFKQREAFLETFAQTILAQLADTSSGEDAETDKAHWLALLARLIGWRQLIYLAPSTPSIRRLLELPWALAPSSHATGSILIIRALLASISCPRKEAWPVRPRALWDLFCVTQASRRFLQKVDAREDWELLLGTACLFAASAGPPMTLFDVNTALIIRRGARWLAKDLPGPELDDHPAQRAIEDYIDRRAGGRGAPRTSPTNSTPPSSEFRSASA